MGGLYILAKPEKDEPVYTFVQRVVQGLLKAIDAER